MGRRLFRVSSILEKQNICELVCNPMVGQSSGTNPVARTFS
jgi:hypothetical protein